MTDVNGSNQIELDDTLNQNNANARTVVNAETVGDYDEATLSRRGPGAPFEVFARCERVVARLKLLNYERDFLPLNNAFKLIPRHYFAKSSNVGEQFFLFTSLAVWLIRQTHLHDRTEMPHEFDDPNVIINSIVEALKRAEFDIVFSPSKLKSGSGPYCVFVLDILTQRAISQKRPKYSNRVEAVVNEQATNDENEDITVGDSGNEDDIEITAEQFDDDDYDVVAADDEDDANAEDNNGLHAATCNTGEQHIKSVLNTFTDPSTMTAELRRVIPQLKIAVRSEAKDWKMHIEQLEKYEKEIDTHFRQSVRPFLTQNAREIGDAMERILSRETHLNTQFDQLMHTFRLRQNELADISEKYRESSGTLNSRAETLENLNEEIEQIKQQIEEQGIRNTNGTPILKIKQALAKMENSIFVLRVQIVVAEQALFQSQLSDRLNMSNGVSDPLG